MDKLNGWQRLWLVASILWGIFILAVGWKNFPTEEGARHTLGWVKQKEYGPIDLKEFPREEPAIPSFEVFRAEEALKNLPARQTKLVVVGFGYWLGGSLLVYIAGWLVAWVRRGFKKRQA